jgi:hypothetical protein
MRIMRGRGRSFQFPKDGAASMEAEEEGTFPGLGFRLVNDDAGRVFRGDPWFGTDGDARGANHHTRLSGFRYGFLGFRLARENT